MTQVTLQQAVQRLADLVDAAVNGEEVVVTGDGTAAVRLVPVPQPDGKPTFGSARGLIEMSDDFDDPLDDLREYSE